MATEFDPAEERPAHLRQRPDRPTGIMILGTLHFLGGLAIFATQIALFGKLQEGAEELRSVGMTPLMLMVGVTFLSVLAIGSGVGMWLGTKWGWWLASFYYVYSIFRNGLALLTAMELADQLEGASRGPAYYITKHAGRVVIHSLLFLYFFKGNVLEYFDLEALNKAKATAMLAGACGSIAALFWVLSKIS